MWIKVALYQNVNFDNYLMKMVIAIFFQNLLRLKGETRRKWMGRSYSGEFDHIVVALLFT